jgi:Zn-dependent protease with chaperone function
MNFFECQDRARRKTSFLVIGFILSIVLIIGLIDGAYLYYKYYMHRAYNIDADYIGNLYFPYQLYIINFSVLVILLFGSISKYYSLNAGGLSIVQLMQAKPISRDHLDPKTKQLIDVVDEISIASGVIAPMIYVLDNEQGINAFVAGYNPNDTVLVVTQGALDNLTRDEMQGVIAHEYSHIFNSDTSLNLRLLIILGGLFGISQVGNVLMRTRDNNNAAPILIGLFLFVVGFLGVICGNIIKAAISRQRESLADASAVQYTRDPNGIARALLKIQQQGRVALMQSDRAEEVNHMCFSRARDINLFGLMASHPKLENRIATLDPTGEIRAAFMQTGGKTTDTSTNKPTPTTQNNAQDTVKNMLNGAVLVSGAKIVSAIGNPTAHSLSHAETILQSLPDGLKRMLNSTTSIQALMYAIAIKMGTNEEFKKIQANLSDEMQSFIATCLNFNELTQAPYRSILVNISLPTLKKLNDTDRHQFLKNIYTLLEDNMNLPKAIFLTVLNQRMNQDAYKKHKTKYNSLAEIENEAICIMFYLAKQGNIALDMQNTAFKISMQKLDPNFNKNLPEFNFDVHELIKSLIKLRLMKPDLKQQFLSACVSCILEDGQVNVNELELLRAICSCLDCPLPLLHPNNNSN